MEAQTMTLEDKVQYHDLLKWKLKNDRDQHSILLMAIREVFEEQEAVTEARLEELKAEIEEQARQEYPGKKRITLPNGYKLGWKLTHKVEAVPNEEAGVRALRRRGLKSLIRCRVKVTYSVNREAVRNNLGKVKGMRAIRVTSYDSFSIKAPGEK